MKIKSIVRTEKFVQIPMEILKNDMEADQNSKHHVFTPSGWSEVKTFEYIKSGKSKIIIHDGDRLTCDPGHVMMINRHGMRIAARADQLNPTTDMLYSFDDKLISFDIQDGDEEDFYDIQIESPHWWFTSGMVSHNSILLCNNAISSLQGVCGSSEVGQDVLLITFELDSIKTAMRCLGAATGVPLSDIPSRQDYIRRIVRTMSRTYKKQFAIYEWAPDECSVNHIYALLDNLKRTKGWKPDVIILDYMDLMMSRVPEYNKTTYDRQKHVANEIRGLAKNEDVLVFTATQTNRGGSKGEEMADLTTAAESFAKQFSLDYVVSLNQSDRDRAMRPARIQFFVAKNRNGPKHDRIECEIEYDRMQVKEL